MPAFKINFIACAAVAGLTFGLIHVESSNQAFAQKIDKANKVAWEPVCLKDQTGKLLGCRIVQRIFIKKGGKKQLFLAVQLRRPKGAKPYVHLQLPLGLALQRGVIIAVMDGKNKKPKLSYKTSLKTCVPRGCIATMPLEKKLLAAMKASNAMRIIFKNNKQKTINITVSLKGLNKAYNDLDGKLK